MEEIRQVKVEVPEGYEIDEEKSSFENIVLKKKDGIKRWEDLNKINGYWIKNGSGIEKKTNDIIRDGERNVFATEKQAKSALAFAQITQLLPFYGGTTDLSNKGYGVFYDKNDKQFHWVYPNHGLFNFQYNAEASRFIRNNKDLLKQYFMID